MTGIILAAGRGRRFGPRGKTRPKCLLEFRGRTLLERHLRNLQAAGVRRVRIVVGHLREEIERQPFLRRPGVEFRFNPQFTEGSLVSLAVGLEGVEGDALWMDADVLYQPEVLLRLCRAGGDLVFLFDPRTRRGEEEMLVRMEGDRVRGIGRGGEGAGESVGFFRVSARILPALRAKLREFIAAGRTAGEYEEALNEIVREVDARGISVGDLAWTEIDFPGDVEKAEREVLPALGEES